MTLIDQIRSRSERGDWSSIGLSRRTLLRTTFGLTLAGLIAACGGDDDDDDAEATETEAQAEATDADTEEATEEATDAATEAETEAATEDETETVEATETSEDSESTATEAESTGTAGSGASESAYPVTIEHKYGSTTITEEPQRVLSLGYSDQDAILALGVKPIAVRYWLGDESLAAQAWAQDELGDATPEVLNMPEIDFEKVASLQPDLIIALYSGITAEVYETLSNIAPVVAQPGEYVDFGIPWQQQTLTVGQALGKEAEAKQLIADVEAQFAAATEAHPEFQGGAGIVAFSFTAGEYGVYSAEDPRSRFLGALGFELPEQVAEIMGDEFFTYISTERMDLLQSDVLIWILYGNDAETITSDPLYGQLPVHQEGRDIFPSQEVTDALSFSTVLSLPYALEQMVPIIVAAIDGDPSTTAES